MKRFLILTILALPLLLTFSCQKKPATTENETALTEDMSVAAEEPVTYTGYLVDVTCGKMGKGMDGSNLVTNPEDHTLHCLEVCAASGFGVMTYDDSLETYSFIPFDSTGNQLAKDIMDGMTEDRSIPIEVTGIMEYGSLTVNDLKAVFN